MTGPVFVDTNVFLYARDRRDPAKQAAAAAWLEYLWREQLGRTSVQVLSEYYVNLTRKLVPGLPPDEAWDDVRALLHWKPQPGDEALMMRGREIERRHRLSWWDSLVVAAAQLQGCVLLLTEDLQDGCDYGGVAARSPFSTSIEQAAVQYVVTPVAIRRPQRGRPRAGARSAAGR
ncbi:MAG: PIN domain-containing protein [Burkholderiales bacterium]